MRLSLVGISHRHAPIEVRERVALDARESARSRASSRRRRRMRVPLDVQPHGALRGRRRRRARALDALRALGGDEVARSAYRLAITRRRCISFASRRARLARARRGRDPRPGSCRVRSRRAGSLLNRLFHDALHAGKKARAQTTIAESPASVSSAAAALAQQVFGDLNGGAC
jgi:hypothetical protein